MKLWSEGDSDALTRLMPLVYSELRSLASAHLKHERCDHTLQTSALVNEAYLRLVEMREMTWQNRARFFSLASRVIRNILVDHARNHLTAKRGGGVEALSLEEGLTVSVEQAPVLVALDDALTTLCDLHPQQAKIVELRYFGGMTHQEIGEVLDISVPTVTRGWRMARAWLYRSLTGGEPVEDSKP